MFCTKCGTLMVMSKEKGVCPSCGHEEKRTAAKAAAKIISKSTKKEVIMIREEKITEPLDSDAVCPKCKYTGAYYLLKQTRSADEPETKFYTCASCEHRWREY
ncbi:MAG: transcription factor S [Thermoplasmataceae archaeon]